LPTDKHWGRRVLLQSRQAAPHPERRLFRASSCRPLFQDSRRGASGGHPPRRCGGLATGSAASLESRRLAV
ncbi:MAG: hypothetical protein LUH45_02960, partial [Clostridiales bacterium]|nr:hypothetical protein [Clostridiales bacterium]